MFSGIIECLGELIEVQDRGTNKVFTVQADFTSELKLDQSIAHDGVCLTVVSIDGDQYKVDAIQETLDVSALKNWKVGRLINLERSVRMSDRLDGHIVQGHVDQTALLENFTNKDGSWIFRFTFNDGPRHVMIPKGSVCVNGVSLTISKLEDQSFEVSIIPYTHEHTNFKNLNVGDAVNIEFDVIGKYLERLQKV